MSKDSPPKEDLHQLLDKAFDENVSLDDKYAPDKKVSTQEAGSLDDAISAMNSKAGRKKIYKPRNKKRSHKKDNLDELIADARDENTVDAVPVQKTADLGREDLHELVADTQMQKASDKIKPKATPSALRSADKLDELVDRSHQQKADELQQEEETVSYNEQLDPSSFKSRKNLYIFRFMAIAVLTAVFTLLAIEHLLDDLSHIVQQKLGPSQILEQMDKELILYHQQTGRLPDELDILISFPANALEWPYQYRMLSNLEGKPEILILLLDAGDYVIYYRAAGRVMMKARGKPVREIQAIP